MPYIKQSDRYNYDKAIESLASELLLEIKHGKTDIKGDANYVITRLLALIFDLKNPSYAKIADAITTLECAKLELYRRVASEYENIKIKENGDAY